MVVVIDRALSPGRFCPGLIEAPNIKVINSKVRLETYLRGDSCPGLIEAGFSGTNAVTDHAI